MGRCGEWRLSGKGRGEVKGERPALSISASSIQASVERVERVIGRSRPARRSLPEFQTNGAKSGVCGRFRVPTSCIKRIALYILWCILTTL